MEVGMHFEITRIKDDAIAGTVTSTGFTLETLRQDAKNWYDLGLADRVEIRDHSGALVHHHPRILQKSSAN